MPFVKTKSIFTPIEDIDIHPVERLPHGNYTLRTSGMGQLVCQAGDPFKLPGKIYGDIEERAERILQTFHDREKSTGILLAGEKGSGKTLLGKFICKKAADEYRMPTIFVNEAYDGAAFNKFVTALKQPCIIFFDEFDKTWNSDEVQNQLLTLMDGVYSEKILFIITTNSENISRFFKNRPGRIYYTYRYSGITELELEEFCEDNLKDKTHIGTMCNLLSLFPKMNFDMLQAIVEEMNRYNEGPFTVLKHLNFSFDEDYRIYDLKVYCDNKPLPNNKYGPKRIQGNPLTTLPLQIDVLGLDETIDSIKLSLNNLIKSNNSNGIYTFKDDNYRFVFSLHEQPDTPDIEKLI